MIWIFSRSLGHFLNHPHTVQTIWIIHFSDHPDTFQIIQTLFRSSGLFSDHLDTFGSSGHFSDHPENFQIVRNRRPLLLFQFYSGSPLFLSRRIITSQTIAFIFSQAIENIDWPVKNWLWWHRVGRQNHKKKQEKRIDEPLPCLGSHPTLPAGQVNSC